MSRRVLAAMVRTFVVPVDRAVVTTSLLTAPDNKQSRPRSAALDRRSVTARPTLGARTSPCYVRSMIEVLPVLIVPYPVLLPESTAFVVISGPADAALVRAARRSEEPFAFATFIRQVPQGQPAGPAVVMSLGCAAVVEQVVVEHGQLLGMRVRGLARVERLGEIEAVDGGLLQAQVAVLDARAPVDDPLLRAQLARVRTRLHSVHPPLDAQTRAALAALDDVDHFADALAAQLDELAPDERLQLLTTIEPAARLALVERLLATRTHAPTRELARVWAALRSPSNTMPGQASLRAQARSIDTSTLQSEPLRLAVEAIAQSEPIPVVEASDSRELQFRRESLAQLTSAIRSLTALRACANPEEPEDVAVQAEIAATIAFLFVAADSEHAAISGTSAAGGDPNPIKRGFGHA